MTEILITFVSTLVVTLGREYLKNRHVQTVAKAILTDDTNPTTDPLEAVKQAWIVTQSAQTKKAADKLMKQVEAGKLRVAASVERARKEAEGIQVEIVPRDGTEVWK